MVLIVISLLVLIATVVEFFFYRTVPMLILHISYLKHIHYGKKLTHFCVYTTLLRNTFNYGSLFLNKTCRKFNSEKIHIKNVRQNLIVA